MWKKWVMITTWNIKYLRQLEQFSSSQHKMIQVEYRKAKNVTMCCDALIKKTLRAQIKLHLWVVSDLQ